MLYKSNKGIRLSKQYFVPPPTGQKVGGGSPTFKTVTPPLVASRAEARPSWTRIYHIWYTTSARTWSGRLLECSHRSCRALGEESVYCSCTRVQKGVDMPTHRKLTEMIIPSAPKTWNSLIESERLLAGTVSDNLWRRFCSQRTDAFTSMRYINRLFLLTYLLTYLLTWIWMETADVMCRWKRWRNVD